MTSLIIYHRSPRSPRLLSRCPGWSLVSRGRKKWPSTTPRVCALLTRGAVLEGSAFPCPHPHCWPQFPHRTLSTRLPALTPLYGSCHGQRKCWNWKHIFLKLSFFCSTVRHMLILGYLETKVIKENQSHSQCFPRPSAYNWRHYCCVWRYRLSLTTHTFLLLLLIYKNGFKLHKKIMSCLNTLATPSPIITSSSTTWFDILIIAGFHSGTVLWLSQPGSLT